MRLSQPNSVFTCRKFNLPFHAGKAFMETTSGQERLRARVWNLRAADPKKDLKTDLAGQAIKTRQTD
jgi:hypothetical protein